MRKTVFIDKVWPFDLMWLSNTDISPQLTYNAQKDRSMHRMKMNIGELSLPVKSVELHTITLASSASVIKHTRGLRWFELNSVILIGSQIAWLMISIHSYFANWNLKHRWLIKPCKVIAKVIQWHILYCGPTCTSFATLSVDHHLCLRAVTRYSWETDEGWCQSNFFFCYLPFRNDRWPQQIWPIRSKCLKMSSLPSLF